MSKLFNLKQWVSLPQAAKHLQTILEEEVCESDILDLALKRHLRLSLRFVNLVPAFKFVPVDIDEVEWEEVPSLDGQSIVRLAKGGEVREFWEGHFQKKEPLHWLSHLWELPMCGAEILCVEQRYQQLTEGPDVTSFSFNGCMVRSTDESLLELQCHRNNEPSRSVRTSSSSIEDFYPAVDFPADAELVVETREIKRFLQSLESETEIEQRTLGTRERDTLLKIVVGMAMKGYTYDPHAARNSAIKEIEDDLIDLNLKVSDDTIRKYLKEAAENFIPASSRLLLPKT